MKHNKLSLSEEGIEKVLKWAKTCYKSPIEGKRELESLLVAQNVSDQTASTFCSLVTQFILTELNDALKDPKAKSAIPVMLSALSVIMSRDNIHEEGKNGQITDLLIMGLHDQVLKQNLESAICNIIDNEKLPKTPPIRSFFQNVLEQSSRHQAEERKDIRPIDHGSLAIVRASTNFME